MYRGLNGMPHNCQLLYEYGHFGTRYINPRTSRWLSTNPAAEEYIPRADLQQEGIKVEIVTPLLRTIEEQNIFYQIGRDSEGKKDSNSESENCQKVIETAESKGLESGYRWSSHKQDPLNFQKTQGLSNEQPKKQYGNRNTKDGYVELL